MWASTDNTNAKVTRTRHAARGAFPSNKLAAERHALKRHSVPAPACRRRPAPES